MMYPKKKRIKSEKYLAWVRSLECAHCQRPGPSEAHHVKGIGHYSGAGMKASDYLTCPMCRFCHINFHEDVHLDRQLNLVLKTLDRAFQEGVIKI